MKSCNSSQASFLNGSILGCGARKPLGRYLRHYVACHVPPELSRTSAQSKKPSNGPALRVSRRKKASTNHTIPSINLLPNQDSKRWKSCSSTNKSLITRANPNDANAVYHKDVSKRKFPANLRIKSRRKRVEGHPPEVTWGILLGVS